MNQTTEAVFDLSGRTAIITGGTGVLGGAMARGLAAAGAKVAVVGRNTANAEAVVREIVAAGGTALATPADVLDEQQLEGVRDTVLERWSRIDILVNAAGGNMPGATLAPGSSVFNLEPDAMRQVMDLNLMGTFLPIQVFGQAMAERKQGSIVNISSMAAIRTLTRVAGYSAAKAGVDNLTRWLAVELGRQYGALRVNAIAPGFFLGEQNRHLLVNEDGSLTARGQLVVDHTPLGRFGEPDELLGTLLWLCSDASRFVTGVVVPVDGGFSSFSGV
jgi:NAD(P)-dependent dehydrogenase (short-subunit alcohol dehydrogenase family)